MRAARLVAARFGRRRTICPCRALRLISAISCFSCVSSLDRSRSSSRRARCRVRRCWRRRSWGVMDRPKSKSQIGIVALAKAGCGWRRQKWRSGAAWAPGRFGQLSQGIFDSTYPAAKAIGGRHGVAHSAEAEAAAWCAQAHDPYWYVALWRGSGLTGSGASRAAGRNQDDRCHGRYDHAAWRTPGGV